jgi:hypothetical protein
VLQRANALVMQAYEYEEDPLNPGQPLLSVEGKPTLKLDATTNQPILKNGARQAELVRYVGLIDSIRQLGQWLGYGPL